MTTSFSNHVISALVRVLDAVEDGTDTDRGRVNLEEASKQLMLADGARFAGSVPEKVVIDHLVSTINNLKSPPYALTHAPEN